MCKFNSDLQMSNLYRDDNASDSSEIHAKKKNTAKNKPVNNRSHSLFPSYLLYIF